MPNHVTNMVLSSPEVIAQLLDEQERPDFTQVCPYPETMKYDSHGINLLIESTVFDETSGLKTLEDRRKDFKKVMESKGRTISNGDMAEFDAMTLNLMNSGFRHQRDWNLGIWSTKWNAYGYDESRSGKDRLVFDTAWGAPDNLLRELSANNVETPIVAMFADEDLGRNCGIYVYLGGNIIYDQCAEVDNWGVGKIQDRWNEFALELKNYDYDEEAMDELRQISIMHKLFRGKKPIGRITPQARKLAGLEKSDEQSPEFLTTLFTAVCRRDSGASVIYNSKGVTVHSRDHETEKSDNKWSSSRFHEGEFFYVADRAIIEFDYDAIAEAFEDLSEERSYLTDIPLMALLQYCGEDGMNLARVLGVLANFNGLVSVLRQPRQALGTTDDLNWIIDWMNRNRKEELTLEFDLFKQFIAGDIQFTTWADKASLPKPSLVPSLLSGETFPGLDDSRLGYEQCHIFKSMCMLYQYRNIITHNGITTEYMDSADGKVYQIVHGKLGTLVSVALSNGLPEF